MRHRSPFLFLGVLLAPLASAQQVVAWGTDVEGQLSQATTLQGAVQLSLGATHGAAVRADGTVVAWGGNAHGQASVPVGLKGVKQVVAGTANTVALLSSGTVVAWGLADQPVPTKLKSVVQVAAGYRGNLALKSDGTVVYWGVTADPANPSYTIPMAPPTDLKGVTQIAEGGVNGAALLKNGTVRVWGRNDFGQASVPTGLKNVVSVAVGDNYVVALQKDGRIVTWGDDTYHVLHVPAGLTPATSVVAGPRHVVATLDDGRVVAWGDNAKLQSAVPTDLTGVVGIAAGYNGTLAIAQIGLVLDRARLHLGGTATGTVTLASVAPKGGVKVSLDATDATLAVPSSVTVPAGKSQTTFVVESGEKAPQDASVRIVATYRNAAAGAKVTVYGALPDLEVSEEEVVGGSTTPLKGTVYLAKKASKATPVALTASNAAAHVPLSLTVAAKSRFATFEVAHDMVDADRSVSVSATLKGATFPTRSFTLRAALAQIGFSPNEVVGGLPTTLTATLNAPLRNGATVSLTTPTPDKLSLPVQIVIPAGSQTGSVSVPTVQPTADVDLTATGTFNSQPSAASVRVEKLSYTLALADPWIYGGMKTQGTVTIQRAFDRPLTIPLSSSNATLLTVPNSVVVPAGATSATFDVVTGLTPEYPVVEVRANYAGTTATSPLTLYKTWINDGGIGEIVSSGNGRGTFNGWWNRTSFPLAITASATVELAPAALFATPTFNITMTGDDATWPVSSAYGPITQTTACTMTIRFNGQTVVIPFTLQP